jgi:hypothetical protein
MISYASNRFQLASGLVLFGMVLVSVALQVVTVFSRSEKSLFYKAITAYGKRMSLAIVSGNLISTFMAKALHFTPSSILAIGAGLSFVVGLRYWFHPNRNATQLSAA